MKNQIDVVVRGLTSSGKTAVIAMIRDLFEEKGLMICIKDKKVEREIKYQLQSLEENLIKEDPMIIVHELNVPRTKE